MGFVQAKNCFHLPYGLVTLEGGKISSREGQLITAEKLLLLLIEEATKEVQKRHADWSTQKIEQTAEAIAEHDVVGRLPELRDVALGLAQ